MISVFIDSESAAGERRVDLNWTVGQLKARLETVTGCMQEKMIVSSSDIGKLADDTKSLYQYGIVEGAILKITDANPFKVKNQFTDTSQVTKFELNDTEYDKKSDSVRSFLRTNKLGKFSDKADPVEPDYSSYLENIQVGGRCKVIINQGGQERLGYVRYIGPLNGKLGMWVGIEYDEPVGKHDGLIEGQRYFQTRIKSAGFVRPDLLEMGEYPEMDIDAELEEM